LPVVGMSECPSGACTRWLFAPQSLACEAWALTERVFESPLKRLKSQIILYTKSALSAPPSRKPLGKRKTFFYRCKIIVIIGSDTPTLGASAPAPVRL
jgi:hypothetical protein